jgi:hypothetical protein
MFFVCGEELLSDEGASVACKMARQGVSVVWEQYEAMPHCFGLIFESTPVGAMCFDAWANFCEDAVAGKVESKGRFVTARRLDRMEVDVSKLMDELNLDEDKIAKRMKASQEKAITEFNEYEEKRNKDKKSDLVT